MCALMRVCDPLHIVIQGPLDTGSDSQRVTSKSASGVSILSEDRGGEGIAGAKPGRGGMPRSPLGTAPSSAARCKGSCGVQVSWASRKKKTPVGFSAGRICRPGVKV